MGRTDWAEAEFADFLAAVENRADVERWRRLPGLHQLSRRGLEMARRLSAWREDEASRQNRPLRQVMRDDVLMAIAKRQPSSRRDLEALRDFNRPGLLSKSHAILAVLDEARAVPDELPAAAAAATGRQPRRLDGRQSPFRRSRPALHAEQGCRLAPGQRLGPQTSDPLVPGGPARPRIARGSSKAGGASSAAPCCSRSSRAGGPSGWSIRASEFPVAVEPARAGGASVSQET